jgi:hypothetical protein
VGDRVEELLRDAAEHRRLVEVLDDHHELVAAEARQQIDLAQRSDSARLTAFSSSSPIRCRACR